MQIRYYESKLRNFEKRIIIGLLQLFPTLRSYRFLRKRREHGSQNFKFNLVCWNIVASKSDKISLTFKHSNTAISEPTHRQMARRPALPCASSRYNGRRSPRCLEAWPRPSKIDHDPSSTFNRFGHPIWVVQWFRTLWIVPSFRTLRVKWRKQNCQKWFRTEPTKIPRERTRNLFRVSTASGFSYEIS